MTLFAALILDALLGEPEPVWRRVPHPAVLMGRAVAWLEVRLNHGAARRAKGMGALCALVAGAGLLGMVIEALPLAPLWSALTAAILIAQRSLVDHVRAVADGLDRGLAPGRSAVSMIVGRDPQTLDEAGVARAAIESAAENFSDGVLAPVFWFAVGGAPGILIYKAVNTADSMIGHRSDRYRAFGWASARFDDLLNLIPARLSGLLLAVVSGRRTAFSALRGAGRHRSPNAGWPEAAMAGALGLALAGPRIYGGQVVEDAWMNPSGRRKASARDIRAAVGLLWRAWGAMVCLVLLGAFV